MIKGFQNKKEQTIENIVKVYGQICKRTKSYNKVIIKMSQELPYHCDKCNKEISILWMSLVKDLNKDHYCFQCRMSGDKNPNRIRSVEQRKISGQKAAISRIQNGYYESNKFKQSIKKWNEAGIKAHKEKPSTRKYLKVIREPDICLECGKLVSGIKQHLEKHNITYLDYAIKHDIDELSYCSVCNKPYIKKLYSKKCTCSNKKCIHSMRLRINEKINNNPKTISSRLATMKKNNSYGKSKPEENRFEALNSKIKTDRQIFFQTDKTNHVIDFVVNIGDENILIMQDSSYWHGLDRPIEQIQEHQKKRDKMIDKIYNKDLYLETYCQENNINLIRFADNMNEPYFVCGKSNVIDIFRSVTEVF
jgi:hypothetical protein